jgi:hypothetical protein
VELILQISDYIFRRVTTTMTNDNQRFMDVDSAVRIREAEGKIEIEKYELETAAKFRELEITESAKEVASKHLAKFAGLYLTFLVSVFIFSIKFVPESSLAVVAGLITLVVTNLSTILKHIVEYGSVDRKKEEEKQLHKTGQKN